MPGNILVRHRRGSNFDPCENVSLTTSPQTHDANVRKTQLAECRKRNFRNVKRKIQKTKNTKNLCVCCKKVEQQDEVDATSKVLTRELPLYDDNYHLLGYLCAGTIIKGPFCEKSREPFLEQVNTQKNEIEHKCPPECKKASMTCSCMVPFPRWVNHWQYEMATNSM